MIQRSYRNLLLALTKPFCSDSKQPTKPRKRDSKLFNNSNPRPQQQQDKPQFKNQKAADKAGSPKEQRAPRAQQRDRKQYQKSNTYKERQSERQDRQDRQERTGTQQRSKVQKFDWEKSKLNELKLKHSLEIDRIRAIFNSHERSAFEKQLLSDIQKIQITENRQELSNKLEVYLEADLEGARRFITNNILQLDQQSEVVKTSTSRTVQQVITKLVEREDLNGLIEFIQILAARKISLEEGKLLPCLEIVSELDESSEKYRTLSSLLKSCEFQPTFIKQTSVMVKSMIEKFLVDTERTDNQSRVDQLSESFDELIQVITKKGLIPEKYIRTSSYLELIERLYFNKSKRNEKYDNLFALIRSTKTTIVADDDYLEEFYQKFLTTIEDARLKSTDCQTSPLLVTEHLLKSYHKFSGNIKEDKGVVIAIIAICLANNYLSVPQHFLSANTDFKKNWLPQSIIISIRQDYEIAKLRQFMKDSSKNAKAIRQVVNKLNLTKKVYTRLKTAIATKDHDKAMSIFTEELFKKICIQKEALIIRYSLKKFYLAESTLTLNDRNLIEMIDKFVATLDDDYLWESWKKSEDLGYLLEDYYIKEGDELTSKAESRFSFWQSYFETKRAREINRFEKLNQLSTLKQPNLQPLLQSEFNLNKYLQPQSYERYRMVADYNDKKQVELEQYLKKVELIMQEVRHNVEDTDKSKVLSYQAQLCQQNLQILQYFGIKDYDIETYEMEELQNRIANLRKYRGVPRLRNIYDRVFKNQDEFDFLGQMDETYFGFKRAMTNTKVYEDNQEIGEEGQEQTTSENNQNVPASEEEEVAVKAAQLLKDEDEQVQEKKAEKPRTKQPKKKHVEEEQHSEQAVEAGLEAEGEQAIEAAQQEEVQVVAAGETTESTHISLVDPAKIPQHQPLGTKQPTRQLVDILRVKRKDIFISTALNNKIKSSPAVEVLIRWGILNREPMAIYMGEKLAMITGQIIPHKLAIRVSDLLNYHREIDQQLFKECKICLTHIGRIDRESIYDKDHIYHHIQYRPRLADSIVNYNTELRNRLQDFVMDNPNPMGGNVEPRELHRKLAKSTLL